MPEKERSENIDNRQQICTFLCKALQATQEGKNIETITAGGQHVFITYTNGQIKPVKVNNTGGPELIKEILNRI